MRITYLLIVGFVLVAINSRSNQGRYYLSSKKGMAIVTIQGWDDSIEIQRLFDSYLDFISKKLQRKGSEPKVLLLLGHFGVHYPKKNFISISYDYLSKHDTIYVADEHIETYRRMRPWQFETSNWTLNDYYPSEFIGSLIDEKGTDKGIIIRYYGEFDSTINYFDRLSSITKFALTNLQDIKKNQNYIRVPASFEGWSLSILTYDTSVLNSIPVTKYGFDTSIAMADKDDWVAVFGLIIVLGAFIGICWKFKGIRLRQKYR